MTERKLAETQQDMLEVYADRLWESVETHQLNDLALAALSDLVVDCSASGRILRANPAFCEFAGLSLSEIEGRDGHEFGFLQNREKPRCTIELQTLSGETTWFDRIQLSMRDPKSGAQFVRIVGRDITEHKRSELQLIDARKRAEAADEAKSRFLAMVSHEIRTPLNGIIGMGKLLADTKLTDEQKSYVEAMTTSGEALLVLVNDLLQFGREELTTDVPKPEQTDIRSLVAGVVELLAEQAQSKNIDLGYCFCADLPLNIEVDAGRLRQLLFNIVGNAVKFTDEGGVRVDVSHEGSKTLKLEVVDTGPGIHADDIERVFQPFEQTENTITRTHEGAGLGLAISKKIAKSLGGDISVESEIGRGSKFEIKIDAKPVGEEMNSRVSLADQSILLVAKHGMEVDILVETMRYAGADVETVSTVEQAQSAVSGRYGSLKIIFDERLGLCAEALAATWPVNAQLIALIEPSSRNDIGANFKAAKHSFLTRPVRPSTLLRVLSEQQGHSTVQVEEPALSLDRESKTGSRPLSVLLAEDNHVNALLARKLLERNNHKVTWVENGAEAVDLLQGAHNFDVVLMDLHMPVMDGLTALKAIRKTEEDQGLTAIPVFAVTADNLTETSNAILAAGGSGILEKPLNISSFESLLVDCRSRAA